MRCRALESRDLQSVSTVALAKCQVVSGSRSLPSFFFEFQAGSILFFLKGYHMSRYLFISFVLCRHFSASFRASAVRRCSRVHGRRRSDRRRTNRRTMPRLAADDDRACVPYGIPPVFYDQKPKISVLILPSYNTFVFWISGSCGHPGDNTTTTTTTTVWED